MNTETCILVSAEKKLSSRINIFVGSLDGKNKIAISRVGLRETSVSLDHDNPIEGRLKPFGTSQYLRIEGFKGSSSLWPHYAERH